MCTRAGSLQHQNMRLASDFMQWVNKVAKFHLKLIKSKRFSDKVGTTGFHAGFNI